ncbi:hypothetical protein BJX61DRAFT_535886 [Aspergillus egyptiacus]|nr:hypothetical protein BJX61DRAFT_535886 [Aspergillus egyptiacus]
MDRFSPRKALIGLVVLFIILSLATLGRRHATPTLDEEECVDCVHYASRVESMIQQRDNVKGNPQFFLYALDKSCRGKVLASGRCPRFRRAFRKDPERFMLAVEDPYEACVSVKACV